MSEKVCHSCKGPIPDGAAFCPRCGKPIGAAAPRGLPLVPIAIFVIGLVAVAAALLMARRPPAPAGEVLAGPTPVAASAPIAVMTAPPADQPGTSATASAVSPRAPATPQATQEGSARAPHAAAAPRPTPQPTSPPIAALFECSRGAEFNVSPEEAEVFIDGRRIGIADDWDNAGGGKTWFFDHDGTYLVRLSLAGYRTMWVKIVVTPNAEDEIADVDTELPKLER